MQDLRGRWALVMLKDFPLTETQVVPAFSTSRYSLPHRTLSLGGKISL